MSPEPDFRVPDPLELRRLGLTREEYLAAARELRRQPNPLELGMLAALWSEHCSYKTSKRLLRQLPSRSPRVVQGPGENAGVVDLGDGLCCCFKIESHNHPSAVEPVQGAATGVGGILRDVFAMGARPVAILDSIWFGELERPEQRLRLRRVVEGVGGYGNCVGVATVGGETRFLPGYRDNCLVNAMCLGLVRTEEVVRARAAGKDNPVLLVGADTGRDGIHGAAFASERLEPGAARRPQVQIGNPFLEKCLLEVCLELARDPDLVGLQDCGAAGLTSSCVEMAGRGGVGLELQVDRVARRERGMTPYEVMLSESQERLVLVVRRGSEERFQGRFRRWGLHSDVIGRVTQDGVLRVRDGEEEVAGLPVALLVSGCPERRPPSRAPELSSVLSADPLLAEPPWTAAEAWLRLLASPNCGDSRWVWRQYDHQVGDDTVLGPGGDAAVLRLKGRRDGLAVTVDGAHRSAALDPARGTAIAVAEAVRNLACVGAEPLALTNCLNFADPERPEVMWQLEQAVAGLAQAARALGIPVVSGNVSLYNEFGGTGIPPTPTIGVVGQIPELTSGPRLGFRLAGDLVALVGKVGAGPAGVELGGSEYQLLSSGRLEGRPPELDLERERQAAQAVRTAVGRGLLQSAHDCSMGGLALALAECAIQGGVGASIKSPLPRPGTAGPSWEMGLLFGETQGRYLISYDEGDREPLVRLLAELGVPLTELGRVGGEEVELQGLARLPLGEARRAWEGAIAGQMDRPAQPGG